LRLTRLLTFVSPFLLSLNVEDEVVDARLVTGSIIIFNAGMALGSLLLELPQ